MEQFVFFDLVVFLENNDLAAPRFKPGTAGGKSKHLLSAMPSPPPLPRSLGGDCVHSRALFHRSLVRFSWLFSAKNQLTKLGPSKWRSMPAIVIGSWQKPQLLFYTASPSSNKKVLIVTFGCLLQKLRSNNFNIFKGSALEALQRKTKYLAFDK